MNDGLVDYLEPSIVQGKGGQQGHFNQGLTVLLLELTIERALQGSRRCRRCAAVHGRYVCIPSVIVPNEWHHSDTGVELIVRLLTCQRGSGPRLQATILVDKGSALHARADYCGERLTGDLEDGPWTLKLISEESECDFVYPGQVEVFSSGKLPTPIEGASFGNGR
jgi:hypothetical protein